MVFWGGLDCGHAGDGHERGPYEGDAGHEGGQDADDGVGERAEGKRVGFVGRQAGGAQSVRGAGGGHAAHDGVLEAEAVHDGLAEARAHESLKADGRRSDSRQTGGLKLLRDGQSQRDGDGSRRDGAGEQRVQAHRAAHDDGGKEGKHGGGEGAAEDLVLVPRHQVSLAIDTEAKGEDDDAEEAHQNVPRAGATALVRQQRRLKAAAGRGSPNTRGRDPEEAGGNDGVQYLFHARRE
mmetsp:Transcript_1865/g.3270  ORF Transcript_1865/g.3270 Transcript_1865/m.3270 type:complete len:237 (+) Transcript_1865:182-892(+)